MRRLQLLAALALAASSAGCVDRAPAAYGDANAVIIAAPDSLWASVEDTVRTVFQPRIFTTRDEATFRVTQISPLDPDWRDLRKFRQVYVVGRPEDPWMERVLAGEDLARAELPTVIERRGIWAGGQSVTAVVLPPTDDVDAISGLVPQLAERLDRRYRSYVRDRMFASGVNDTLPPLLRERAGFELTLPMVYRWVQRDSVYVFQNAFPDPSQRIRTILVTWRTGTTAQPDLDAMLDWREAVAADHYEYFVQRVQREERIETGRFERNGLDVFEAHGVWRSADESWPAAGLFITRTVPCPEQDRTYLLDAWLYAPSQDKYEYVLQLNTILDSFECG